MISCKVQSKKMVERKRGVFMIVCIKHAAASQWSRDLYLSRARVTWHQCHCIQYYNTDTIHTYSVINTSTSCYFSLSTANSIVCVRPIIMWSPSRMFLVLYRKPWAVLRTVQKILKVILNVPGVFSFGLLTRVKESEFSNLCIC